MAQPSRPLDEEDARHLADAVKQWMGEATQDEFAHHVGVVSKTISRLTSGSMRSVSFATLQKVSRSMGVNPQALELHLDGEPLPPATAPVLTLRSLAAEVTKLRKVIEDQSQEIGRRERQ